MPRETRNESIDTILEEILSPLAERLARGIAEEVAHVVASQLEADVLKRIERREFGAGKPRRRSRGEITRWVADRGARRVPTFVIEATGLDTKKKIVAKYGENATFEKGRPLPKGREDGSAQAEVKAKGPIVRKKANAAA